MKDSLLAIYPTARKVEDQLVRLSRGSGVLGHRATTLPQVVDALWNDSADLRQSLSQTGERLVMREAVARVAAAGSGVELTEGTADRMLALIRQLKSAAIIPDDWTAALKELPGRSRSGGLDAFTTVFATYQSVIAERGLADRHDREATALKLLLRAERAGDRPRFLDGVERLLVAEIYDLSLLQFMIIAALIRITGDAELTIQAGPHRVDARRFADLTWNRFVGEESIADKVLPEFVRREGRAGRLGFLLERIFTSDSPTPPPPDTTVTVIDAPDPRAEAEEAARTIRRMRERPGEAIALDRIALVARDLSLYRDHLEAAFRRHRIPLQSATGQALRGTTPARALYEIIETPLEGYRRDALVALCTSAFIRTATVNYRTLPSETGYIDHDTRPLADCVEKRQRELTEALDADEEPDRRTRTGRQLDYLERGAKTWLELLDRLASLDQQGTLPEHLQRLGKLLEWLKFDPVAGSLVDSAACATGALWAALDDLAGETARVMPDRTMTLREFAVVLDGVLRETELESGAVAGAAVRALPVMEARGLDFDLVFILGLNDGSFPLHHPENPLLPDETVRTLNPILRARLRQRMGAQAPDAPGPILRSRSDRNAEEPFLFFLALSMPSRELVLSSAAEDEHGKPLGRSPFLNEVVRLLEGGGTALAPRRSGSLPQSLEDCFAERDYLNFAAAHGALKNPPGASALGPRAESILRRIEVERGREYYLAHPTREQMFKRWGQGRGKDDWATMEALAANREKALAVDRYNGRVTPNAGLTAFLIGTSDGGPRRWSAGQLTELAGCGFRFFARRILRLREDDEADHERTRLETGELVHRILRTIFDSKPDFGDSAVVLKRVEEITIRFEKRERGAARDPAFFDVEWAAVRAMIDEVVAFECARHARGDRLEEINAEYPLDFTLEGPPTAGAEPIQIKIAGAIDRLELRRNQSSQIEHLRVIDYKASRGLDGLRKLLEPGKFATTNLQLPIYLLGAIAQLGSDLAPNLGAEAGYIALKRREKETAPLNVPLDHLDPKLVAQTGDQPIAVATRVFDLVNEALEGHFDVDPLQCSDWCAYRPLCRFNQPRGS